MEGKDTELKKRLQQHISKVRWGNVSIIFDFHNNSSCSDCRSSESEEPYLCGSFPPLQRHVEEASASTLLLPAASCRPLMGPSAAPAFSAHRWGEVCPRACLHPSEHGSVPARPSWISIHPPHAHVPPRPRFSTPPHAVRCPWSTKLRGGLCLRESGPCGPPAGRASQGAS